MAAKDQQDAVVEKTDQKTANLGNPNTGVRRQLAEDLPEKDEVQEGYKDAMTADSMKAEVAAKVKVVDASPNAANTPSGAALKAVAGIANDTERGEEYARVKSSVRHGYVTPDLAKKGE